jgi:hypothetical protein
VCDHENQTKAAKSKDERSGIIALANKDESSFKHLNFLLFSKTNKHAARQH